MYSCGSAAIKSCSWPNFWTNLQTGFDSATADSDGPFTLFSVLWYFGAVTIISAIQFEFGVLQPQDRIPLQTVSWDVGTRHYS